MEQKKSWNLDREWIHTLYLDAYFEDALTKMRAATGLGATYALFTALNEYFHEWGYLDDKGYEYHKAKYGKPLVGEFESVLEIRNQATKLEIQKRELEIKKLSKQLVNVLDQWPTMKPKARAWYVNLAKQHLDLPIAQKILKAAKEVG